ncbi:23S rRNA (uracil(747)-C(5))-methyltransferase RlmC [Vibrio cidicii]|uniref:23S rRNA (uracil(747)-C(5))-methyltransferase RlmC n=1 Tax=Vibrio cidicii TaxID=1763883 RepID=A0A151JDV9_9VIBR|nr:23S rRNA (uracil(747)-C(5))-methyltransferase RlmC [Vibrio cidicii]KYN23940.1 23S rRNA (uracil(747)-C(5))-methyltransferase [Vibrio cidicii]MBG0755870.1 23S rRNA (uracil(747)-C(5))-methyltransferase [Vibrio cidicii]
MPCEFFHQKRCTSCTYIEMPYLAQIEMKDAHLRQLFPQVSTSAWLAPEQSQPTQCRNKAKMVALGAAHQPILGIESVQDGSPVSLTTCPLYQDVMRELLSYLQNWIRIAGIPPYNKVKKKGELKFILLTQSQKRGEFMLRFVLRSENALQRIRDNLPRLQQDFPAIRVVTANIQPIHMARLEGEQEIFLTSEQYLLEEFNGVPMVVRPKSFFQTNPHVAARLYATARDWVAELKPRQMWDLFCGVGGFALHCAPHAEQVIGIEIEEEAINSAKLSAQQLGIDNLSFSALDSAAYSQAQTQAADLILVNPPRRGLGQALTAQLEQLAPHYLIYSSCNPVTMQQDLAHLPSYRVERAQWFDMFPHTDHAEVMMLLKRND